MVISFVLFLSNHNVIPPTVWGQTSHTNPSPYFASVLYNPKWSYTKSEALFSIKSDWQSQSGFENIKIKRNM